MKKDKTFIAWLEGSAIFLIGILMLSACQDTSDDQSYSLKRPFILNNTLVAGDSSLLRGGTFWIYGWIPGKTTWALSDGPWKAMRKYDLNVVRVSCAYRPENENNYSLDQYETYLDQIIDRADSSGVYVVIDFHPKPGTYDMKVAKAFWGRFAGRYNDRKNVIYELINEPKFSKPEDYTDQNLRDFETLWRLCDNKAPSTPIIIMSFCQVGNSGRTPRQVTDSLRGIDWSKTAVGFHSYWRESSKRIVDLKEHYPCINTEFHRYNEGENILKPMDGHKWHGTLMEKLGISWIQWDNLDTKRNLKTLEASINDLKDKGFYWEEK